LNKRKKIKEEGPNPYTLVKKIIFFSSLIFPPLRFGAATTHLQRKNPKLALMATDPTLLHQLSLLLQSKRRDTKRKGGERCREKGGGAATFVFRECREQSLSFRFRVRKGILFIVFF
jgi:hypothetical protein